MGNVIACGMTKFFAAFPALLSAAALGLLTASCGQNEIEDPTGFGDTGTDSDIEAQNKRELNRLNWKGFTDPEDEFRVQLTGKPEFDDTGDIRSFTVDAGDAGDFDVWIVPHGEDENWETKEELIKDMSSDDDPTDRFSIVETETKQIKAKGTEITEVRQKVRGYYVEQSTLNGVRTGTKTPLNSSRVQWYIPSADGKKTYYLEMNTLRPEPEIEERFFGSFTLLKKPEPAPTPPEKQD